MTNSRIQQKTLKQLEIAQRAINNGMESLQQLSASTASGTTTERLSPEGRRSISEAQRNRHSANRNKSATGNRRVRGSKVQG